MPCVLIACVDVLCIIIICTVLPSRRIRIQVYMHNAYLVVLVSVTTTYCGETAGRNALDKADIVSLFDAC